MKIEKGLDSGPVMLSEKIEINDQLNYGLLSDQLSILGSKLIIKAIDLIDKDKAKFLEQDHTKATHAKKITREDEEINWNNNAVKIVQQINGLNPTPGACFKFENERIKIWKAEVIDQKGKIGTLICWDQWYPEAARLTALQGAQVLFYPTAIGWLPPEKAEFGPRQYASWETIQRGHAIANGVFVAAANRWGLEQPEGPPGLEFWGQSFVADPSGQIISQASSDRDEVLIAEIDPALIEAQRHGWPFLRDRRIDAYQGITQRYLD